MWGPYKHTTTYFTAFVSLSECDALVSLPMLLCDTSASSTEPLPVFPLQLRQSFVAGLYQCTAFQAAQIGGMAALVEYPAYMVSNPKSLR